MNKAASYLINAFLLLVTSLTTQAAIIDCVGSWSEWSTCSKSCGSGIQTQTYTITTQSANGGNTCSDPQGAVKTQACNEQHCPIDCVGTWSDWTPCSKECGNGSQSRTYTIKTMNQGTGSAKCLAEQGQIMTQKCNTHACPVDCIGAWSAWSPCNKSCGVGTQSRTYEISTETANGGSACAASRGAVQSQSCNTQPCNSDCIGSWSSWSACSRNCGGGISTRVFTVTKIATNNGAACVALQGETISQPCNEQPC